MPTPSVPLTAERRTAYKALLDKINTAMQNTADPAVLQPLLVSYQSIDDLLTLDTDISCMPIQRSLSRSIGSSTIQMMG